MKATTRGLWIVFGVLLAGVIFQFFLRYQYIHTSGPVVMRIDRLSGTSCYMPCLPAKPTPQPTTFDFDAAVSTANEEAIALVRALPSVDSTIAGAFPNSKWNARPADRYLDERTNPFAAAIGTPDPYMATLPSPTLPSPSPTIDQVRLVSYGTTKGGFYWEVHLDTKRVYYVNDDAALSAKYLGH